MRLGVLISGRGSNLNYLLEQKAAGALPKAEFVVVASNNPNAPGLEHARRHGIPTVVLRSKNYAGTREQFDAELLALLEPYQCEALVLAGYMRILSSALIQQYRHRLINIHPALLPSFPGTHGVQQALDYGVRITGCTVHYVDEGMDTGPIILQTPLEVLPRDTEESLASRLRPLEHQTLLRGVELHTEGRLKVEGRHVRILEPLTPPRLFLATGNAHKMQEIQAILGDLRVCWDSTKSTPQIPEPEETGCTYHQNAEIKARYWAAQTKFWALSDDSGLEVEALGGRPGLYSARYGNGMDPIERLLGELQGVTDPEKRRARFFCVVCLAAPGGQVYFAEGEVRGQIAFHRAGSGGFGYDPIFIPDGHGGRHLSELSEEEKNAISHRGNALRALVPALKRSLLG
ncbi:MAG: phosphoribosylglycinamide formyltransferase [Candidatus Sumerlaeia bacterium]|nr:phosphoribosylglycinamide formyltransferase [Candidatus Sumerlaeia bacterium]